MRKLSFWLLWAYVFSLPWEPFVSISSIGTITRLSATAAIAVAAIATMARGSIRRPGIIIWLLFALTLSNVLTLFWTIAVDETSSMVRSYVQLFAMVWVVWEIVRLPREAVLLIFAYCAGAYVSIVDTLLNFATGAAMDDGGPLRGRQSQPK